MRTAPLSFRVSLVAAGVTKWLNVAGDFVEEEAAAITFTFRPSTTPVDRLKIERLEHDLAGGLRDYLDLTTAIDSARRAVVGQLEEDLWPDGRPVAEGDAADLQARALDAAFRAHDSIEKRGLQAMQNMVDRLRFLARWEVLGVGLPDGWAKISERVIDDGSFYAVWSAYDAAHEGIEQGKGPPSAR